jgi:hypothetical protein
MPEYREKYDRALFWLDIASRHWPSSMSSSYSALVTAVEALTERGAMHKAHCPECQGDRTHESRGPTARFKDFFEKYAPGSSRRGQRDDMYRLRSMTYARCLDGKWEWRSVESISSPWKRPFRQLVAAFIAELGDSYRMNIFIPYSLAGDYVFKEASRAACAKVTSREELWAARGILRSSKGGPRIPKTKTKRIGRGMRASRSWLRRAV